MKRDEEMKRGEEKEKNEREERENFLKRVCSFSKRNFFLHFSFT